MQIGMLVWKIPVCYYRNKKNDIFLLVIKRHITMKNTKEGRSNQVEEILENKIVAQVILRKWKR